jgi:hypothetical protein
MIRICWPATEQEPVLKRFRSTPDRKRRHRLLILLLAHRGRPHQDIAHDLGITPRTVPRWLNAYLEQGVEGLRPRKAPGATPRLTEDRAPWYGSGLSRGPHGKAWTGPTGRTPNWPSTCAAPAASR